MFWATALEVSLEMAKLPYRCCGRVGALLGCFGASKEALALPSSEATTDCAGASRVVYVLQLPISCKTLDSCKFSTFEKLSCMFKIMSCDVGCTYL